MNEEEFFEHGPFLVSFLKGYKMIREVMQKTGVNIRVLPRFLESISLSL